MEQEPKRVREDALTYWLQQLPQEVFENITSKIYDPFRFNTVENWRARDLGYTVSQQQQHQKAWEGFAKNIRVNVQTKYFVVSGNNHDGLVLRIFKWSQPGTDGPLRETVTFIMRLLLLLNIPPAKLKIFFKTNDVWLELTRDSEFQLTKPLTIPIFLLRTLQNTFFIQQMRNTSNRLKFNRLKVEYLSIEDTTFNIGMYIDKSTNNSFRVVTNTDSEASKLFVNICMLFLNIKSDIILSPNGEVYWNIPDKQQVLNQLTSLGPSHTQLRFRLFATP